MTAPTLTFPRTDVALIRDVPLHLIEKLSRVPGVHQERTHHPLCDLRLPRNCWTLPGTRDLLHTLGFDELRLDKTRKPLRVDACLRDHQAKAVDFIQQHGRVLLGDQMGIGKTRTAAVAAESLSGGRPVLIVAPRTLRRSWRDELTKIGAIAEPDDFVALEGVYPAPFTKLDPNARFIFIHYDIINAWWNQLWQLRPSVLIMDEAHHLKNSRTKRAKAAALAASTAEHRILLTGTPILNRLGEMWNLLNLTCGKWGFGTPSQFRMRYCGAEQGDFGLRDTRLTHTDELRARLSTCYLRRTAEDVKLELPPITRQVIEVDLTEAQASAYASALGGRDPRTVADAILYGRASTETLNYLSILRKITSDAKRRATSRLLASILDQEEDVVCFSWRRETAEDLSDLVFPGSVFHYIVHGGRSHTDRDAAIERWRATGGLLSATLGALAEGHNLQRAHVAVMHDLDFTPARMLQAEARVWRQGQTKPVHSYWMVAKGTLDAFIARHLINKSALIEKALDDTTAGALGTLLADQHDSQDDVMETIRRWQSWRNR